VDASGFASLLLGKSLEEPFENYDASLFCDRAVVGGWARSESRDWEINPYTTAETMDSGWCWQIDHENRINRGYVYCSAFISDSEAETEFRTKNPGVSQTRVVKFSSGRYRNQWVKNVVAVGNAGGFVEPLEATALGAIASNCVALTDTLVEADCRITPRLQKEFNRFSATAWDDIRDFLAVHYKFNNRIDSPFWRHCLQHTDLAGAAEPVELYRESGPCFWLFQNLRVLNQFGMAGYITMLLGQKVEYRLRSEPSEAEMSIWRATRQRFGAAASHSISVRDALAAIRSPLWQWNV
jgi:tryptophan halogenase